MFQWSHKEQISFSLNKVAVSDISAPGKRLIPGLWHRVRERLVKERSWHGEKVVAPAVAIVEGLCPRVVIGYRRGIRAAR